MYVFDRLIFFPLQKTINNENLHILLNNNLLKERISKKINITDISSLNHIKKNSILFLKDETIYQNDIFQSCNIITPNEEIFNNPKYNSIHLVKNFDSAYNAIVNELFIHEDNSNYFDEFKIVNDSHISINAQIDSSSRINKNCVIGKGVKIGKNCIIKNNVVIKNAIIGNNVIIGDNTTIGSTGFGFSLNNMGATNMAPQVGIVVIEDNVSIGSNCSIDRGKIDFTFIGENSMLDNLIHVAHNVIIKKNVCIAAQTGISGSVEIGNNVIVGGQVGFAGHIKIGDNAVIAAKSGVTKNILSNSTVAGFPAIDIKEWKRNIINSKKNGHK